MLVDPRVPQRWESIRAGCRYLREAAARASKGVTVADLTPDPIGLHLVARAVLATTVSRTADGEPTPDAYELAHWQVQWAAAGFPVLAPTVSLVGQLVLTDCEAVPFEALQPPFPAFAVKLPDDTFTVQTPKGRMPVRELVFFKHHTLGEKAHQKELAEILGPILDSGYNAPRVLPAARAYFASHPKEERWLLRLVTEDMWGVFWAAPPLTPGAPLGLWLKDIEAAWSMGGENVTTEDRRVLRTAWRLFANLCLYVDTARREQKLDLTPPPRNPAKPLAPHTVVVGREVKLPAPLRDVARAYVQRHEDAARWKVAVRTYVRGHWKMQPCGPGGKDRVRRRIEPYWRGPETGTIVEKTFTVAPLPSPPREE